MIYDVGPNVFKFTHRTFLEYFFARHLLSSSDSIATLIRQHLLSRVRNSEWDVIAHLAVQTAVFRDAGKMVQAAETIASIIEDQFPDARSRVAFLTFVAKALEYLLLPERQSESDKTSGQISYWSGRSMEFPELFLYLLC